MKKLPDQETLRNLFSYNEGTGELRFKTRADRTPQWNSRWGGKVAGNKHDSAGRSKVMINGSLYFCHRVIWKWMTGDDPSVEVDHRDTNPANNRWVNLRLATGSDNCMNKRAVHGRVLPKGVSFHKASGKYVAQITVRLHVMHLGVFDQVESARLAYGDAAKRLHKEFARMS
jgi:hypothetical protein